MRRFLGAALCAAALLLLACDGRNEARRETADAELAQISLSPSQTNVPSPSISVAAEPATPTMSPTVAPTPTPATAVAAMGSPPAVDALAPTVLRFEGGASAADAVHNWGTSYFGAKYADSCEALTHEKGSGKLCGMVTGQDGNSATGWVAPYGTDSSGWRLQLARGTGDSMWRVVWVEPERSLPHPPNWPPAPNRLFIDGFADMPWSGSQAMVVGTDGDCANIRDATLTTIMTCIPERTIVSVAAGPYLYAGYEWFGTSDSGWIAGRYLLSTTSQVSEPDSLPPTPTATPTPYNVPAPMPTAPPPPAGDYYGGLTLDDIDGSAVLVADDGTYLGLISSSQFDSDSICNEFGDYGSQFSRTSIRNEFGRYGSGFSRMSAYNEFTRTPPMIVYDGEVVGFVTKNEFLSGSVDPDILFASYGCVD